LNKNQAVLNSNYLKALTDISAALKLGRDKASALEGTSAYLKGEIEKQALASVMGDSQGPQKTPAEQQSTVNSAWAIHKAMADPVAVEIKRDTDVVRGSFRSTQKALQDGIDRAIALGDSSAELRNATQLALDEILRALGAGNDETAAVLGNQIGMTDLQILMAQQSVKGFFSAWSAFSKSATDQVEKITSPDSKYVESEQQLVNGRAEGLVNDVLREQGHADSVGKMINVVRHLCTLFLTV
jgi:hypothetical protein